MAGFDGKKLQDFFEFYVAENPKHQNAVLELAKGIRALEEQVKSDVSLLSDEANWARIYRTQLIARETPDEEAAPESIRPAEVGLTIDWNNPQAKISKFFRVKEVTQGDRRRIPGPDDSVVKNNIIRLAKRLDEIRSLWGQPIGVTSWYRPPAINAAVGGVRNSTHILGLAADIYTTDGRGSQFEKWLDERWTGGLGYGVASGRGFTHVDLGQKRRWRY